MINWIYLFLKQIYDDITNYWIMATCIFDTYGIIKYS
jgi:hypothetical protein